MQRLVFTALIVHAFALAGSSPSQASVPHASKPTSINGQPCGNLCQAYIAWSDRMLAKLYPRPPHHRVQPRLQARATARHQRPQRAVRHATTPRRRGATLFAQLAPRSDAALRLRNARAGEIAPPPAGPVAEKPVNAATELPAEDATIAATDLSSSSGGFPETIAISTSVTEPVSEAADASGQSGGRDIRLLLSLALALGALLAFLLWGWFRASTQTANAT
jgi:hypothetical protein